METPCRSLKVFDEIGRYLGEVALPFEVWMPVVVQRGKLYAVTEGESGEPLLVRARIN